MKTAETHYNDVVGLGRATEVGEVALEQAYGCVLADDVMALHPLPPFTASAADGYAVRAVDVEPGTAMPVMADVPVDARDVPNLLPGSAIRVRAGSPLPIGADSVVRAQDTTDAAAIKGELPTAITPTLRPALGAEVRAEGEEMEAGSRAFSAGTELTAAHIAALVALGYSTARVHRRPLIGIISAGDAPRPVEELSAQHVPDANAALVAALASERGGAARILAIGVDKAEDFERAMREAIGHVECVITTGGLTTPAFASARANLEADGINFSPVAIQPGKAQGFGAFVQHARPTSEAYGFQTLPAHVVPTLCLPGNPVGAFVSMQLFGLPLIDALMGRPTRAFDELFTPELAGTTWEHRTGREQFMPVMRAADGRVIPAYRGGPRSHTLSTLPFATGLARVAPDRALVGEGEEVSVLWFR